MSNVKNPLYDLYEKLYFHELEVREKLIGRIQTPMAIIVPLVGVLTYLLLNFENNHTSTCSVFFVIFLLLSAFALFCSIFFIIRSWHGIPYSFLPAAEDTEAYRIDLENTYSEYENGKDLAEKYLYEYLCAYYIKCSSDNTRTNDLRVINLHKANRYLIATLLLTAFCFMFFYFCGLDKSQIKNPIEISIVKPVEIKGIPMQDKKSEHQKESKPPLPPPPPPLRQIKEGVEIVKPQQEKK
jgi:hypothetical protein